MGSLKDLSKEIEALVEKASQSVVRVDARRGRAGTGIVWDSGLVLTANHVVEQEEDIEVVVDGKSAKASLVGRDPATDLALLKVDGLSAPAMPRAKVSDLKPGQIVLAIGRPGSLKATFGTISAVSSPWRGWRGSEVEHLIQTNAPLYPGFSGGPLVDADGRAVGMNSWVFGRGDGRAIAMDVAERVVESLRKDGRIKRPYLGIGTQEVPLPDAVKTQAKQDSGLLVVAVEPKSPADHAGLMQGDTLLALDSNTKESLEDLFRGLRRVAIFSMGRHPYHAELRRHRRVRDRLCRGGRLCLRREPSSGPKQGSLGLDQPVGILLGIGRSRVVLLRTAPGSTGAISIVLRPRLPAGDALCDRGRPLLPHRGIKGDPASPCDHRRATDRRLALRRELGHDARSRLSREYGRSCGRPDRTRLSRRRCRHRNHDRHPGLARPACHPPTALLAGRRSARQPAGR